MNTVETVSFEPSETFQPAAARIVGLVAALVRHVAPEAAVEDMGGTAVPGLLTKGDVDVNVRVDRVEFDRTVAFLRLHFHVHQPGNWTDGYASFADDKTYPLPVGVQVTIRGHRDDRFLSHRDRLAGDRALIERYNELKREYEGAPMVAYRQAKWAFIAQHLERT